MRTLPEREGELFETALRWMEENIIIAGGVYRDASRLRIARTITLDRRGRVKPWSWERPSGWKSGMLNSTIALTCCCYIAALGKVASAGDKHRCDRAVFESFVDGYMKEAIDGPPELRAILTDLRVPAKHAEHNLIKGKCQYSGGGASSAVLYKVYRCGFVHSFWPKGGALVRRGVVEPIWCMSTKQPPPRPQLNVDRLAWELLKGIKNLRDEVNGRAKTEPGAYREFVTWLSE